MTRTLRSTQVLVSLALMCAIWPAPLLAQQGQPVESEVVRVSGDLYRVRDGASHTVFLVTPEGIVLADPLSTPAAMRLSDELETRFPGRAVRFVLYTHHHFDRAEDGGVFGSAERIAHRRFNNELAASRRGLPEFVDAVDSDSNGVFSARELAGTSWGPLLASKDRDGDGQVTPDELYRQVPDVRRTYEDRLDISLGGRTVALIHPGRAHAADMSVLFFPGERMLFAADPPPVASVPFTFGRWQPSEVFDWIRTVAPLDFETALFGDGTMVSKAQLTSLSVYLEALREEVASGYERGFTPAELRAGGAPANPHAAARGEQIDAIFRTLRLRRVVLAGSGAADYGVRAAAFCASFATCSTGGAIGIGTAALTFTIGRFAFGAEGQMGAQSWHSRTSAAYDEEFALRETRFALLVGYARLKRGLSFTVVAGPAIVIGDAKGMSREKGALAPLGGRHALAARGIRTGVTGGVDMVSSLGSRMSLVVPIRFTRLLSPPRELWPADTTITVGVGLSMRIARVVN